MAERKHPPMKDRRDIGEVRFPIEDLLAARASGACCVHIEAVLDQKHSASHLIKLLTRTPRRDK